MRGNGAARGADRMVSERLDRSGAAPPAACAGKAAAPVTDEEISFMLREGAATGHIPHAETAIVEMALRLGDRRVSAVMTPRTQVEWLDLDDPEEENRRKIRDSPHSRFPVMQGGTQQVIGIARGQGSARRLPRRAAASIYGRRCGRRSICRTRSPCCAPSKCSNRSGEPMALIVDEYGDLEGLVDARATSSKRWSATSGSATPTSGWCGAKTGPG